MKLWDFAIRQPVAMTMILVAGIVLGALSFRSIPVNLFPDVEFPVIVVSTVYPGASPAEVEDTVTSVMEEEFSSLQGIDEVNSSTFEGLSNIILVFDLDTELSRASQEVQDKVNVLKRQLPTDVEEPTVRRFNPSDNPILRFAVADTSESFTSAELRTWVEENIQLALQRVPGVAAVDVDGGDVREIQVNLDLDAMEARRITAQQILAAIRAENLNIPGGSITTEDRKLLVRTPGNFQETQDLADVIISQAGASVYLRDVATVVDGFEEREVITRLNGKESITVSIRKQSGSNTLAVSDGVKAVLAPIREAYPQLDITIGGDESIVVRESTGGALSDLLWGALLASLTILFFFRNLRNSFLTIIGLPLIMISSISFLEMFDISLNNISLLALALVVGLVIDDGIVVRENILRWIERGYPPMKAASLATGEVILPVLATTATILAVFIPVAYAEGLIGRFFRDFGLTVSIAIVISTFEALTLAPLLASRFFKANAKESESQIDDSAGRERTGTGWLDRRYGTMLNWSMNHRWLVLFMGAAVVAASFYGAGFIKTAFLPSLDRGFFDVTMQMPPGTPLSLTEQEAVKVEEIMRSHPHVEAVFTTIGTTTEPERAAFFVKVSAEAPGQEPTSAVIESLRKPLVEVPGISFALADAVAGGDTFIDGSKAIVLEVLSSTAEYNTLGQEALTLLAELEERVTGLTDTITSYNAGKPEFRIDVDRSKASRAGLSTAQIGSTIRTLVNGEVASTFRGEGDEADIVVRLRESDRLDPANLLNMNLLTPAGQQVPLKTVATTTSSTGPTEIQRRNREFIVTIGMNVVGRDTPTVVEEVQSYIASRTYPEGIRVKLGGDAEAQAESFANLGLALLLAVVFIYMVLAAQFASFIQPLLIMLAMPLSIIGALIALLITDRPLDMTAFIGFIMLMGLVTKNSILLVDFANQERSRGVSADLAMRRAGPIRLRPILMTALSLILAMVPIVVGFSEGSEFRQSMSIAIMGGMVTSTLLTLFIVPVAYSLVIGIQDRGKEVERYQKPGRRRDKHDLLNEKDENLKLLPDVKSKDLELVPGSAATLPARPADNETSRGVSPQPIGD